MGLIATALGAVSSTLADQYKEYFYCDALENDVLAVRAKKHTTGLFAGNKGSDNVITAGSHIVVADGQCMIVVDDGAITCVAAEPGVYTYDTSSEVSVFSGTLGDGIKNIISTIGKRIEFGGETAKCQRVYYVNIRPIIDNLFGTQNPVPFQIVDSRIGLDIDATIRMAGSYTFQITDPVTFFANVCSNVGGGFTKDVIEGEMKREFLSALNPALGALSKLELRPSELISHTTELEDALNKALDEKWHQLRGIEVVNVAISTVTLPEEYQKMITDAQMEAQKIHMYANPQNAAAGLSAAKAQAMKDAANNPNGAMNAFMAVNQFDNSVNTAQLYAMGNNQPQPQQQSAGWTCGCGTVNTGNFCSNCGAAKPSANWTCSCGTVNSGNFCSNCGKPRQ